MADHLLYIDDSGTKRYADTPTGYERAGNTPYFVFGGVLIPQPAVDSFQQESRALKRNCFGTEDVEIKSNWLRLPGEREERFLNPYGINEDELDHFVEAFYELVNDTELQLLAAVIDKPAMQREYGDRALPPPTAAYEILMQRVEQELRPLGGSVSVTVDDMEGKTSAMNQYKRNLKNWHDRLKQHGSLLRDMEFRTLQGRLTFVGSENSELIQTADIAAYNVYRQFVEHGEEWEQHLDGPLPAYDWFLRVVGKFRTGRRDRIQGYGVAKLPLGERVPWRVQYDEE